MLRRNLIGHSSPMTTGQVTGSCPDHGYPYYQQNDPVFVDAVLAADTASQSGANETDGAKAPVSTTAVGTRLTGGLGSRCSSIAFMWLL